MYRVRDYHVNRMVLIPGVDRIHHVLTAFFRTSDAGNWRSHPDKADDIISLHFIRGNWAKQFVAFGPSRPQVTNQSYAGAIASELTATIRPSPVSVKIGLEYVIYWQSPFSLIPGQVTPPPGPKATERPPEVDAMIDREVTALRKYLSEWYGCDELPEEESE